MFVFCQLGAHSLLRNVDSNSCVDHLLKTLKINDGSFYVLHNGRKVEGNSPLEDGNAYHFVPRILGGKGGPNGSKPTQKVEGMPGPTPMAVSTRRQYNKTFRDKLAGNPERYEVFKAQERERVRIYRKNLKITISPKKLEAQREKQRERQRRYRERLALTKTAKEPVRAAALPAPRLTRCRCQQDKATERREKNRLSAQKMRDNYTPQKRAAKNRQRMQRYWLQKREALQEQAPEEENVDPFPSRTALNTGFGSMLRAIGAQIEKTTSREACRDLSGRRMRDVNNEKQLKDWLAKEADREREREERRQEKLARRLAGPKHNFDDPEYHKQRSKVQDDLDDALEKGLKRVNGRDGDASSSSRPGPAKKVKSSNREWLGMDIDSDDLDSDSGNEANPGSPNMIKEEVEMSREECAEDAIVPGCSGESSKDEIKNPPADVKLECGQDVKEDMPEILTESVMSSDSDGATTLAVKVKEEIVNSNEPIDLDDVKSSDDLVAMGLERLKNGLMSRGLKCGGTLEERADRLFSVKGLTPDQIPSSLIAKSKGVGKKSKSK